MTNLKLSEAIRLGAMIRPQVRGEMFKDGGSCVLGAGSEACGAAYDDRLRVISPALKLWPWLEQRKAACPVCALVEFNAAHTLAHLNDRHEWTREQIADYVATIEPQDADPVSLPRSSSLAHEEVVEK